MSSQKLLAIVGIAALVIVGVYLLNQSQKSDVEKLGDSIERAADDVKDAVKKAVD